jgi:hypothetical protein
MAMNTPGLRDWAFAGVMLVACGFLFARPARAGVTVTVTDTCTAEQHALGDEAQSLSATVVGNVLMSAPDFILHEPSGDPLRSPCARDTRIHPFNDLDSPSVGSADPFSGRSEDELATMLKPFSLVSRTGIVQRQAGAMPHKQCSSGMTCVLPEVVQKTRGFELRPPAGGGQQPSGTYSFMLYGRPPSESADYRVPFVLLKAHKGDWLEFSLRGVVFYRAALADLDTNTLYFAPPPEDVPRYGLLVLGLYLNAETGSDSEVYVPIEIVR